jgi:hypothetical protein
MKKEKAESAIIVTLENICYTWNGNRWYGPDFIQPPAVIIAQLHGFMKTKSETADAALPVKRSRLISTPKKTIKKAIPKKKAVKNVGRKVKMKNGKTGGKSTRKKMTKTAKPGQTSKVKSKKGSGPLKTKKTQAKKVKSKR